MTPSRRAWAAALLAGALCGCVVGPKYHKPQLSTPSAWGETAERPEQAPLSRTTSAEADLSRWWSVFDDPELDRLITRALAGNLDLKIAASRIRQARQQEIVAAAAGLPTLKAEPQALHVDIAPNAIPSGVSQVPIPSGITEFFVNFDAAWEADLFGGVRRQVESARALTAAQVWSRRDTEVSLTAEVATDYLAYRGLQRRIAIAKGQTERQLNNLNILTSQAGGGVVPTFNATQQRSQYKNTAAQVPSLEAQARVQVHALGVLLGMEPEALSAELEASAPLPGPPPVVPVGLPADLLRRRPDVRAAERQLASANAQVGAAIAQLYPQVNLNASGSLASTTVSRLFEGNSLQGVFNGYLTAPIFEGGRLRANVRSAREQDAQALLQYRSALLVALREVEDALANYAAEQRRETALKAAADSARRAADAAMAQYRGGLVTYINVLTAEQALLSAEDQVAQSDIQLDQDLASLFKALGGGWSEEEPSARAAR